MGSQGNSAHSAPPLHQASARSHPHKAQGSSCRPVDAIAPWHGLAASPPLSSLSEELPALLQAPVDSLSLPIRVHVSSRVWERASPLPLPQMAAPLPQGPGMKQPWEPAVAMTTAMLGFPRLGRGTCMSGRVCRSGRVCVCVCACMFPFSAPGEGDSGSGIPPS